MKHAHVILAIGLVTGCAGLIGVPDLTFDEGAEQGNPDGSVGGGADGSGSSGGADGGPAPACDENDESFLQTSRDHCGRCGHSCLGGECKAGTCQPIELVSSIDVPEWIALDATYAYVTGYGDGTVVRVRRDGSAPPDTILTGLDRPSGLAVDGTTLYISDYYGLYKCTVGSDPQSCAATRATVHEAFNAAHFVRVSDGTIYLIENGDMTRILPNDGGAATLFDLGNAGWHVATNGTHLYYTSNINLLYRALMDGGSREAVGPKNATEGADYVAVDGDSFFWSFHEMPSNTGRVFGGKHAEPNQRTEFAPAGLFPRGIAADPQYVYWADRGPLVGDESSATTGEGKLLACPRAGCGTEPIVLASDLRGAGPIVLDDVAVYFGETDNYNGGRVRKIAKP